MRDLKTLTVNGVTYKATNTVPTDSVTLLASDWKGDGEVYSQVVEVPGVTAHTKIDLQPTSEQLAEFHYKTLAFVAENEGGIVTVYSIGDKPDGDHTIQITKTEVEGTGKIRGNTVGTTMPRPDWNQTDPTKADYIKNKPRYSVTPEMFGAVGDGVTDDSAAFIAAIMTGKKVVCDSTKTYYFANPVDVRTLSHGHLDGNNAHFVNFHIFININDEGNDWREAYSQKAFTMENMILGCPDHWYTLPDGWETPCITTGSPMVLRNILATSNPYVLATADRYIDHMLFEDVASGINWELFDGKEITLDAICCLNRSGEYCNFSVTDTPWAQGDGWLFSQCREFRSSRHPEWKLIRIGNRMPVVFESCVQLSIEVLRFGQVVAIGGHWENGYVTMTPGAGSKLTFIGSYFYLSHNLINFEGVTYINCYFRSGPLDLRRTLADMTGNLPWHELKCKLINCEVASGFHVTTDDIKHYRAAPKKTYNPTAINQRTLLADTQMGTNTDVWLEGFFPGEGVYKYRVYLLATSQPSIAIDSADYEVTISTPDAERSYLRLKGVPGGFGLVVLREAPNGALHRMDWYADPGLSADPSEYIEISFNDWGSFATGQYVRENEFFGGYTAPWVAIDEAPVFDVNPLLMEANGVLVTLDDSESGVNAGQIQVKLSGATDKYELIETVTIEEAERLVLRENPDGSQLSYKEVVAFISTTGESFGETNILTYSFKNGATYVTSTWTIPGFTDNAATKYYFVRFWLEKGYWHREAPEKWTDSKYIYTHKVSTQWFNFENSEETHPAINILATEGELPAGTTVTLYGVKA